jgi:hypothetical protein
MSCPKVDPPAELVGTIHSAARCSTGRQSSRDCGTIQPQLIRRSRRHLRGFEMLRKLILMAVFAVAVLSTVRPAEATPPGQPADWQRFYYYPYIYYPHTFQKPQQYDNMYYRYEPSMRIPVYNKNWYNFYPTEKPYHSGHHYILDVF